MNPQAKLGNALVVSGAATIIIGLILAAVLANALLLIAVEGFAIPSESERMFA